MYCTVHYLRGPWVIGAGVKKTALTLTSNALAEGSSLKVHLIGVNTLSHFRKEEMHNITLT